MSRGHPEVWKFRWREPDPPPLRMVLDLWDSGCDTQKIASMFGVREAVIYNILARAERGAQ